jgi:hypothetical protein
MRANLAISASMLRRTSIGCAAIFLAAAFISAQVKLPLAPTDTAPGADFPKPKGREWPVKVGLARAPEIRSIDGAAGEQISPGGKKWKRWESPHFQLWCDEPLATGSLRDLGSLLEATWELNCRLPMNWEPTPPSNGKFTVRIFRHTRDYVAAHGTPGAGGVFRADTQEVMLPVRSLGGPAKDPSRGEPLSLARQTEEQGTLAHEATHQMMRAWLPNLPLWFSEGAAEYVAAADYSSGEFRFRHHLQFVRQRIEKWLPALGKDRLCLPLGELMKLDGPGWRQLTDQKKTAELYGASLALTAYFYHGDGRDAAKMPVFDFVEAVRRGAPHTRPAGEHLLRGRSAEVLQADCQRFWTGLGLRLVFRE